MTAKIQTAADAVIKQITNILDKKESVTVAIDGRCGSGKTSLAEKAAEKINCNVFHMDDFFLRPEQRTQQRYLEPGGNVDRERFLTEVLKPLCIGRDFEFRPFDCRTMSLAEPVFVKPKKINLIEGTYSCHPELATFYDLKVFLTVEPKEQLRRIKARNGDDAVSFVNRWIPLEEMYFSQCCIEQTCDMIFKT